MNNSAEIQFKKQYQDSLRLHLKRSKQNRRSPSRAAREVGSRGLSLGLNAIDLARTHEQALSTLEVPIGESFKETARAPLSAAGKFLLEALVPFEQSRRLAYQFLLALEEERKEISHELHNQVAQILAGINVRLAALNASASIDHENFTERIAQTQTLVEQSVKAIHSYARKLRPAMLDDLGLIPSLRSFLKELPAHEGLRIRFSHFPEVEDLDNLKRTIIYRVAQEAVTNVLLHSKAKNATVKLRRLPDSVVLEISDDGKSFPVERVLHSNIKNRLGLLGMRERVAMVEGDFYIESSPGKGTTVRATIPISEKLTPQDLNK